MVSMAVSVCEIMEMIVVIEERWESRSAAESLAKTPNDGLESEIVVYSVLNSGLTVVLVAINARPVMAQKGSVLKATFVSIH